MDLRGVVSDLRHGLARGGERGWKQRRRLGCCSRMGLRRLETTARGWLWGSGSRVGREEGGEEAGRGCGLVGDGRGCGRLRAAERRTERMGRPGGGVGGCGQWWRWSGRPAMAEAEMKGGGDGGWGLRLEAGEEGLMMGEDEAGMSGGRGGDGGGGDGGRRRRGGAGQGSGGAGFEGKERDGRRGGNGARVEKEAEAAVREVGGLRCG